MANHYIRQDLERQMILLGLTDEEIAVFINVSVLKELNYQKSVKTLVGGTGEWTTPAGGTG